METPAAIDGLLAEAEEITQRSWFVENFEVSDRTDTTITLHFFIDAHLLVQVFFSQRSERLSLALIGPAGRLRRGGIVRMGAGTATPSDKANITS